MEYLKVMYYFEKCFSYLKILGRLHFFLSTSFLEGVCCILYPPKSVFIDAQLHTALNSLLVLLLLEMWLEWTAFRKLASHCLPVA